VGATAGASEAAGLPAAEKSGIFWPRATEFIVSIAEMPVWIISSGYVREYGLIGIPIHNNRNNHGASARVCVHARDRECACAWCLACACECHVGRGPSD
jgi:hypothetical protein